jgi:hypothetical protein
VDVLADAEVVRHRVQGRNLRAVGLALKTWEENPQEILGRLWLGGETMELARSVSTAKLLLRSGFKEMAQWLQDQGGPGIQGFLGERGEAG